TCVSANAGAARERVLTERTKSFLKFMMQLLLNRTKTHRLEKASTVELSKLRRSHFLLTTV
ncbi:MAG TPA: hypothetical protein PKZ32_22375, partial [Candidatus Melainabacteria bacterium]|nr:hypothetical protein [Candidatus Melainabacteria bacterium]